ncbi:MAG: metalloregulator ArsR/SmtB family transcription factor [Candidatus Omnitrophota bacterium]|nr:metalloregulator ArsR/SmtB family transcription factor [Candidatus Omnitrophota bacterium]
MAKKQRDVCELFCYNKSKVEALKKSMISEDKIAKLTEIFKILGDIARTRILFALSKGELCVCDIAHVLGLSLSAVSHQLRILRNLRLVKYRNEARMVFYSLLDKHIIKLIKEGITYIRPFLREV